MRKEAARYLRDSLEMGTGEERVPQRVVWDTDVGEPRGLDSEKNLPASFELWPAGSQGMPAEVGG